MCTYRVVHLNPRLQTNEPAEVTVLAAVANNPHISSRQIQRNTGISKTSVLRILKRHSFHPYHIALHQELHENDFINRIEFCQWALQQLEVNEFFFNRILFTDESTFTNHGQWIGRGGHISWPARSPDLNPLDFFVGNVKEHCLQ
ncbi:hypothetical protein DMN91_009574 [Ooceraea biroi]|uniref:DUF4817 domain-containing protein n=1 Tax=Ooceraea biroi TaxID=2015173 RepID=A0A3L8DAI5_OOCBI|nr:hypothetical protein DMN91_009574 [Ooceraea biroi]